MFDQSLGTDQSDLSEMAAETRGQFEEAITIRRFVSQPSSAGAFKTPQAPVFTSFPSTALVVEMNVAAKMFAAGVLSAGDIVLEMTDRLNEGNDNIGGSQGADRVIYRGMEYRMVQRPQPVGFGSVLGPNVAYWIVHLRRTNATTDSVGG